MASLQDGRTAIMPALQPKALTIPAMAGCDVRVQREDFDVGRELAALRAASQQVGAVASFVGTVRAEQDGETLTALHLEHYPGMTERAIAAMVDAAQERFALLGTTVVHRVGTLAVGEQIVLVATASSHRRAAFAACEFLMDYLKTQAPFWKRAHTASGTHWVAAQAADEAALARWGDASGQANAASAPRPGACAKGAA